MAATTTTATYGSAHTPVDIAAEQPGWTASGQGNQTAARPTVSIPADAVASGNFYVPPSGVAQGTNGASLSTAGLSTTTGIVNVSQSAAPSFGQVLTATSATTANWSGVSELNNTTINGDASSGQVLAASGSQNASWQTIGSGSGVSAVGLGLAVMTNDPASMGASSQSISANTIWMSLVTAGRNVNITKLGAVFATGGATPGTGVNGLAIYSEAGALLAATGDMTTVFEGTGAIEGTISFVSLVAGTNYYLCMQTNFTGSSPQVMSASGFLDFEVGALNGHVMNLSISATTWPSSLTTSTTGTASHRPFVYAR